MSDIPNRVESLNQELEKNIKHYLSLARLNYRFAMFLMATTLIASAVASLGGFFFNWSGKTTGGVAAVPGIVALIAAVLKPQGRANWHYRKTDGLKGLRRRLRFQLPDPPLADNVAAIAGDLTKLDTAMSIEWEKNFSLNWSLFANHNETVAKDPS